MAILALSKTTRLWNRGVYDKKRNCDYNTGKIWFF